MSLSGRPDHAGVGRMIMPPSDAGPCRQFDNHQGASFRRVPAHSVTEPCRTWRGLVGCCADASPNSARWRGYGTWRLRHLDESLDRVKDGLYTLRVLCGVRQVHRRIFGPI